MAKVADMTIRMAPTSFVAFEEAVQTFSETMRTLKCLFAMQAENQQRQHRGEGMAYVFDDFMAAGIPAGRSAMPKKEE